MKNIILVMLLSIVVVGCSLEEQPSQAVLENTLPEGGPTIKYDSATSFTNIDQITSNLSAPNAEKFNASLGWYGTESNFGLMKLDGKTAKEVIDIVNCLKKAEKKQQLICFDK
ncbi:hypothetical protein [Aliikangiella sp. IMCC44359]|uniref:hypothetical protein n=1 Tax=Aliikangiella sp. IMCC44359 TaxID=3459125 RepID=UPI00403AAFFA